MNDCISYRDAQYFSDLICDYLDRKDQLTAFYNRFPRLENFTGQLKEKADSYPNSHRKVLVEQLQKQYASMDTSPTTLENITQLADKKTFTITTGHQLNVFSGPLYFLYKIISVINLTKTLKKQHPDYNFVPVYWLASEDHDFEEINFFNYKDKKIKWNRTASGAVGELSTEGMDEVFADFKKQLDHSEQASFLKSLFEKAYLQHENLAEATLYFVNKLFGDHGLVCIDANCRALKNLFTPNIKNELHLQNAYSKITEKAQQLEKLGYKAQVNPREINLFYLDKGLRERLIKEDDSFVVNNTSLRFTAEEIDRLVDDTPEKFSPNVVMRPLYQEVILPNLCYIGGGGELAYWFELKDYFNIEKIPFPILLLRNSALLVSKKTQKKLKQLEVPVENLFLHQTDLVALHTKRISDIALDFRPQKEHLSKQFENLYQLAQKTDKSFLGAVAAQEKKQLRSLDYLEKRLLNAQKRKLSDELNRLTTIQDELFPGLNLQERVANFSRFYMTYREKLIPELFQTLDPLEQKFKIIYL